MLRTIFSIILIQYMSLIPLWAFPSSPASLAKVLNISKKNDEIVAIELDKRHIYAEAAISGKRYSTINGVLELILDFSDREANPNLFHIYESNIFGPKYLGDIEFICTSSRYYQTYGVQVPSYITLGRCSLELPQAVDTFSILPKPQVSHFERVQLLGEIFSFKNRELQDYLGNYSMNPTLAKCILITQFIWSLEPLTYPADCVNLGLMDKIRALKERKLGMVSTGFRDLFIEIASVLMPDVPIRKVDAFRCLNPGSQNFMGISHALLEVSCDSRWLVIDPTNRFYLTTAFGESVDINNIRFLRDHNRLSELRVVHIPTSRLQVGLFDNPESDTFSNDYWCHFNWLNYYSFQ